MNKTKEKTKEKMLVTNSQKLLDGEMEGDPSHTHNHGYARWDLHDPSSPFGILPWPFHLSMASLGPSNPLPMLSTLDTQSSMAKALLTVCQSPFSDFCMLRREFCLEAA